MKKDDIRVHAVAETGRLHLRGPDDELLYADEKKTLPRVVVLYGPASKQFANAQNVNNKAFLERVKRKGKDDQSAEEKTAQTAAFLAKCTHSFENISFDDLEGKALFTAVYADLSVGFIADQVNKHLGDWANFTKGAQPS